MLTPPSPIPQKNKRKKQQQKTIQTKKQPKQKTTKTRANKITKTNKRTKQNKQTKPKPSTVTPELVTLGCSLTHVLQAPNTQPYYSFFNYSLKFTYNSKVREIIFQPAED